MKEKSGFGSRFFPGIHSLRTITIIGIGGAVLITLLAYSALVDRMLTRSFEALRNELAMQRVERAVLQVDQIAEGHLNAVRDYAEWDDTYAYVLGDHPEYLAENFLAEYNAVTNQKVFVIGSDRELVGSIASSPGIQPIFAGLDLRELIMSKLLGDRPSVALMLAGRELIFLAAAPILPTDRSGPSPGWLVFARPLDAAVRQKISRVTGVEVDFKARSSSSHRDTPVRQIDVWTSVFGNVSGSIPTDSIDPASPDLGHARVEFPCLIAGDGVLMTVSLPLWIFRTAEELRRGITVYATIGGVVFVIVALVAFEFLVLRRVIRLNSGMRAVAETRDDSMRVEVVGADEIAEVARTSNRVLDALAEERKKAAVEQSILRGILDSAGEGVMAIRPVLGDRGDVIDFVLVKINRKGAALLDVSAEEAVGRPLSGLVNQFQRQQVFGYFVEVLRTGKPTVCEVPCHMSVEPRWFRHSICPWEDGIVSCFEDISKRRAQEAALAEMLDELTRLNTAMMGREERILDLKAEINALRAQMGQPPVYYEGRHHV